MWRQPISRSILDCHRHKIDRGWSCSGSSQWVLGWNLEGRQLGTNQVSGFQAEGVTLSGIDGNVTCGRMSVPVVNAHIPEK